MNYATQHPLDRNNYPYPSPAKTTTQSQNGVPTASSVITLSPDTTMIELTCIGGAAANSAIIGKWGSASVTGTNFDIIVQSGLTRPFVVPVSVFGSPQASVAGANAANGLYASLAVKTATAQSASVFSVEY